MAARRWSDIDQLLDAIWIAAKFLTFLGNYQMI